MKKLIILGTICGLLVVFCGPAVAKESKHKGHSSWKKKILEKYDADKDGKLSDDEKKAMKAAWAKRRDQWKAKMAKHREDFMKKYDTDKDGKLSDDEKKAIKAAWDKRRKEYRKKHGDKRTASKKGASKKGGKSSAHKRGDWSGHAVARLDKNNDGKLSADEIKPVLRSKFTDVDTSGDGYVDKAEFKAAAERRMKKMRKEGAKKRGENVDRIVKGFMKLDKNGDGKLSADEIRGHLRSKFKDVDKNGDGYIDAEEIKRRLKERRSGKKT